MRKTIKMAILAATASSVMLPAVTDAQTRTYRGRDGRYHERYEDRRDYERCKRSSGTTGTIAGGAGGAVLGNVLGGGTLGTVAGGVGGALLGRHLDKKHDAAQNRRNGC